LKKAKSSKPSKEEDPDEAKNKKDEMEKKKMKLIKAEYQKLKKENEELIVKVEKFETDSKTHQKEM
jgi:hypothetical protein